MHLTLIGGGLAAEVVGDVITRAVVAAAVGGSEHLYRSVRLRYIQLAHSHEDLGEMHGLDHVWK